MEGCVKYADRRASTSNASRSRSISPSRPRCSASPARSISIARATCSTRRSTRARSIGAMPAGRSCGRAPMPSRRRSTPWSTRSTARKQPIICSGGGVIWSQAWNEMRQFVEKAGIPFYTTPQGRGVVPDDHPYSYLTMRSTAFRDADLIIILGTRMNYVIGHAAPPRFGANAKIARIEIDAEELGRSARNVDIPVARRLQVGAGAVDRRAAGQDRRQVHRLAAEAGGRRGGEAHRARRQLPDRRRHPPAAPVRGGQELHEARRDPVRRRPGDPEFRPPVDADLRARPSAQFRAVRHDGRRAAVRGRRQGRQARQAGHLRATATARSA